jgi:hypothetical protein
MGTSLTVPPPKHAGGAMFYPITSRAVGRRKDELDVFGCIGTGRQTWAKQAHFAA